MTSIGDWAFEFCTNLASVSIGGGVTSIGDGAFRDCVNLTSVTIPGSVTNIGNVAFYACPSLTSVTIPGSVSSIGDDNEAIFGPGGISGTGVGTFADCNSLKAITVDPDDPAYSSVAGVLFDKNQSTLIEYPGGLGGSYAIPMGVTSIAWAAFCCSTNITSVAIPSSVTGIATTAFNNQCPNLTAITVDAQNSVYSSVDGVLFDKTGIVLIQCPGGKAGTYTIPNGVKSVASYAFYDCVNLTGVTIPDSVTYIGEPAFVQCSSLTAITVSTNNPAYSSVAGVLLNQSGTTLVGYPGGMRGTYAIPNTVTSIGDCAFLGCTNLTAVTLDRNLTNIGDSAFESCSNLVGVTIPNSVGNIGFAAFQSCCSLSSVTIPGSVTNIGPQAFLGCSSLISVTIPNSVTGMGGAVFAGCARLTSATIGNGVTTIGGEAFESCLSLTNVTIGSAVTNIGDVAFASCVSLRGVYCQGNAPTVDSPSPSWDNDTAFDNDNNATVYYLPGTSGWSSTFAGLPAVMLNPPVPAGLFAGDHHPGRGHQRRRPMVRRWRNSTAQRGDRLGSVGGQPHGELQHH